MDEEMHLLRENVTAPLICLKEKKWWGGRWVHAIKNSADGPDKYEAKGESQSMGVD